MSRGDGDAALRQGSLLQRLYFSRLAFMAVIAFVLGLAILIVANIPNGVLSRGWPAVLPFKDIGTALLSTSVIIVAFEYLYREETELRAEERLRRLFPAQADAVMSDLYRRIGSGDPAILSALSTEAIDKIITSALTNQLGEADLAQEVYSDLRRQVIATAERWRNFQVSVILSRYERSPRTGSGSMLQGVFRCEYSTVLTADTFRFTCVSDLAEYRRLLRDPASTLEWYFEPVGALGAESDEVFDLLQFSINGESQSISRTAGEGRQTFVVDAAAAARRLSGQPVYISYAYAVLVQRNSHMLQVDVAHPARGLRVELVYSGCGIRFVSVLDFIASASEPRTLRTSEPSPSVAVVFDGWVFPKSGVAFVWVLEEELRGHQDG